MQSPPRPEPPHTPSARRERTAAPPHPPYPPAASDHAPHSHPPPTPPAHGSASAPHNCSSAGKADGPRSPPSPDWPQPQRPFFCRSCPPPSMKTLGCTPDTLATQPESAASLSST